MAESLQLQMEELRTSIKGLEAQRTLLGDAIINPALKSLRGQLAMLEEQAAAQAIPAEERRMVTILFLDMVGSTSRAEKLDPEEWRQVIARFHSALGEAITAHHGTIAQYLGDGLLAFFGSKEASEHDPENAIRAALAGQASVTALLSAEKVQLRAGIHSGLVVVGELGESSHKEFTASGDAMNLAARLQSAAPAGGILISHDTYRYVRGVFDVTPMPPLTVKGKSEPLQTYLVRRAKPRPFRSVSRGVAGVEVRTIGRAAEMQTLQSAYQRAYAEHATVWAQLLGDPGVGKSRLLEDMSEWLDLRPETFRFLRARAFPDDASQPFALVRRMWFDRFQIAEDAALELAEKKWVERFREFSGLEDCEEKAHALGLLVGLPFSDSPHIGAMRNDPAQVKGRALVVSRELLLAVRQHSPVVLLLEDMQWADPASWEYLVEVWLGDQESPAQNGAFILSAARSDWQPPKALSELCMNSKPEEKESGIWGTFLQVAPLSDADMHALVGEILQRVERVPAEITELLVERSEGIPYYVEEMVNWFIDHAILDTRGQHWQIFPEKLKEQPLPATLQHLLLTRLGSLTQPERAALQRGAIFGRRFWTGGVEALGAQRGAETLGALQPRGFVEAQPESAFQGETEWNFHQNLLQEVTYESVLKRERATLHGVAAEWLEKQAAQAGRLEEFAGLLGEHYERAGELVTSAEWYLRAGRRAMGQGAPAQARDFFSKALDLLPPVDRERRWQALLGREEALSVLSETGPRKADIASLLELANSFGHDEHLAEAYYRQASLGGNIAEVPIMDQAIPAALAAARRCGNQAIEAKTLILNATLSVYHADGAAASGFTEQALQLARRLGDEDVLAFVLLKASWVANETGNVAKSAALTLEQVELEHRLGNRTHEAIGLANIGTSYAMFGMNKQARSLMEQARAINVALGARRSLAYCLGNLGDLYMETGDLRKAHEFFEQALHEIGPSQDARGNYWLLTEMGLAQLAMGDAPAAERSFDEALQYDRQSESHAVSCDARAGLAACALAQGKLEQARQYAHEAWDYIKEYGYISTSPGEISHLIADTFDALGETEELQAVLATAHQALLDMAEKIDVPEWRQSFLENAPHNRAIMEMWERRQS